MTTVYMHSQTTAFFQQAATYNPIQPQYAAGWTATAGSSDDIIYGSFYATQSRQVYDPGSGIYYYPVDSVGGHDTINAGGGNDQAFGGAGSDLISGEGGSDYLRGDENNDQISGGDGVDDINGNAGNDHVSGNNDNDVVRGGQGDDQVFGNDGNDWLSGDAGYDYITGGSGADVFHSFALAGYDVVLDFNYSEGDRVLLDSGTSYSAYQSGADVIVDMGGGNLVFLSGVSLSSFGSDWISA